MGFWPVDPILGAWGGYLLSIYAGRGYRCNAEEYAVDPLFDPSPVAEELGSRVFVDICYSAMQLDGVELLEVHTDCKIPVEYVAIGRWG